jgi:site-specific recombinase XerD
MKGTIMTSSIKQNTEAVGNNTWMEPCRKAFLELLVTQGYSVFTRRRYKRTVDRFFTVFGAHAVGRSVVDGAVLEEIRRAALSSVSESDRSHAGYRLERFIGYLVDAGEICLPEQAAKKPTAMDKLRMEYDSYLRLQRGLSEATIEACLSYFGRFMAFRFKDGVEDLNAITPDDIFSFLRGLTTRVRHYNGNSAPSHLRNLFKFLFWSGKTKLNLAASIPRIAQSSRTSLPRYLKPDEIQKLIDAAWSDDAKGRRDHAIILLLARLGLRAPEVVAIQLEDIDWRAGEILIRGKGKLHDRMPLPNEVGEAIVSYIQNGRPSGSRSLFVSDRPPHQAFKDAQIINAVLNKAFEKSGLKQPQQYIGSHLLRHSLATGMLGKGASLEEISHVLRHRSRATTTIYAKCDINALRSIAQAWPSEGGVL